MLIESSDSCKWGLVIMRSSQRRSMKQEKGRLRVTAKLERIDGARSEGVYEIVPMRDTDEMHGCFAENQSPDSTSKVLGSILMSVSLSNKGKSSKLKHHDINIFPGTRKKLIYILSVCRTTQRRTSKNDVALCKRQLQQSIAPQPKSRCENDSATSGWRLQDTQHRLDSMFPKRFGFYRSSETFGQVFCQLASFVN